MRDWSPIQWLGFALLVDVLWIFVVFLLRSTKLFLPAWGLGIVVTGAGLLLGGYCLITLISLSQTAGEAGLGGVGALMGIVLSLPFGFLFFVYVRAYRRHHEGA